MTPIPFALGKFLQLWPTKPNLLPLPITEKPWPEANMLYGVTMGDDGVSKLLSVKLDQAKAYAK